MIRTVLTSLLLLPALLASVLASPALACTPGPPLNPLEEIADADIIAIAYVDALRGPENAAPTVTPQPPTSPSMATPAGPFVDGMPDDFSLEGYGARLRISRRIVGQPPDVLDVDTAMRTRLEATVRVYEAGRGSNCPVSDPRLRYPGTGSYLVFLEEVGGSFETYARFRMDGAAVITTEPGDVFSSFESAPLFLNRATAEVFFPPHLVAQVGLGGELVRLEGQVPIDNLLRVFADLRGDPTIIPPETGTAGLQDPTP